MVDTSRHYYPVDFILHTIDALAYNKMNVFHWHVLDADSFPIVSLVYPELSLKGAYSQNAIYTPNDVNLIIKYAGQRGVRVVIEFDIPGHSSFGKAYPVIVGCPNYYDHPYVYQKQSVALDPTLDLTYEILGNFLREFDKIFPDAFLHLGGDEVRHVCWEEKPSIKEWMDLNGIANYTELERYFWGRLQREIFPTLQKTIILWDDAFVNQVPIDGDTIVHIWQEEQYMIRAIRAGHRVIRSRGWYLDQAVPGAYRYRWLETWIDFYMLEPVPANLTPAEEAMVLGGQPCMWTEQVDSYTFDALVWPRTSAAAERLWSDKNMNNSTEAGYRLMDHRCRLHLRNVDASPIFPDYCERDFMIPRKEEEKEIEKQRIHPDIVNIQIRQDFQEITIQENSQEIKIQQFIGRMSSKGDDNGAVFIEESVSFGMVSFEMDSDGENAQNERRKGKENQGNPGYYNRGNLRGKQMNFDSLAQSPEVLLAVSGFVFGALFMAVICLILIHVRRGSEQ